MICVVYEGYGSSILTLIFITCIWFPFLHLKHAFIDVLYSVVSLFHTHDHHHHKIMFPSIYHLSNIQFNKLLNDNGDGAVRSVDESCSICLAEFRDEDIVSQLNRCRHVFHACCIERWLDRDQFTCPLCRSRLLCKASKKVELSHNSNEQFIPWQW